MSLNIILTTAAAWRLSAELWVIPAVMCSLAGLMNFIPTDDVYLPVRPIRLRPLNQKSNVRLSWHSVHDKYQPVKSPGILMSVVRYYINGKMKLSATLSSSFSLPFPRKYPADAPISPGNQSAEDTPVCHKNFQL